MTSAPGKGSQPTPMLVFETLQAYQRSFAMKAAIELDLFTAIAKGNRTVPEIAKACAASERGIRILCDYLTIVGHINKADGSYSLPQDSAVFLDSRSPAYVGKAVNFLLHPMHFKNGGLLGETIRKGSQPADAHSSLDPEDSIWMDFAHGMIPLVMPSAQAIAQQLEETLKAAAAPKVLDIAASHGIFGITIAQKYPKAQIYALDWANVLQVAQENARKMGVAERYHLVPGSVFEVEPGHNYDAVLLTNFLHHFEPATCVALLKKLFAAMNPSGQVVILEFVPNEDRISPPQAAMFSLTMLMNTPTGDAYTFAQLAEMCTKAGFQDARLVPVQGPPQSLVIATKK